MSNTLSATEKKRLCHELHNLGVTNKDIAARLNLSPGRITQILKEAPDPDFEEDGSNNERVLLARAKLLELQGIALERKLKIEADALITADRLEEVLRAVMRRYGTYKDWLRKHRPGDTDAMDAFCACPKAALKECKQRGWLEGEGIDDPS